jgi:hypothetical protein
LRKNEKLKKGMAFSHTRHITTGYDQTLSRFIFALCLTHHPPEVRKWKRLRQRHGRENECPDWR